MTALAGARNTPGFGISSYPSKSNGTAAGTVYKGSMVARDSSGTIVVASADATLRVEGIANESQATGENVNIDWGAYWFQNSAGVDAILADDIGKQCYAQDDQTVALTSGEGAGLRPLAGLIVGYDATRGVAVFLGAQNQGARVLKIEQIIEFSDLTAAAVTETLALGTLPAGAWVLHPEIYIETLFSGASASACVLDFGGTDADGLCDGHDVFTGAATGRLPPSTPGVHPYGYYASQAMTATFTATGDDVADLTAGKLTITIPYLVL